MILRKPRSFIPKHHTNWVQRWHRFVLHSGKPTNLAMIARRTRNEDVFPYEKKGGYSSDRYVYLNQRVNIPTRDGPTSVVTCWRQKVKLPNLCHPLDVSWWWKKLGNPIITDPWDWLPERYIYISA